MPERVRLVARRGDAEKAPENTLPAFESAIRHGADAIELDVHQTADEHLIVHHFYNLGSTDNGKGLVGDKTLAELKTLDSGGWFSPAFSGVTKPTFQEVLELCRGRIGLEIDLKEANLNFLQQVCKEILNFGLQGDVELTTAHTPLLSYLKEWNPKFRTGTFFHQPPPWMSMHLAQRHILAWASLLKIDAVHIHSLLITADFVNSLHRTGFTVYGSNLDTEEEMIHGIQAGIDSFSTGHLGMALQTQKRLSRSDR